MEALNSVNIISGLGGIRKQKLINNVKILIGEGVTSILDQVRFPRSPGMKES